MNHFASSRTWLNTSGGSSYESEQKIPPEKMFSYMLCHDDQKMTPSFHMSAKSRAVYEVILLENKMNARQ